jgi:hypothetical protein
MFRPQTAIIRHFVYTKTVTLYKMYKILTYLYTCKCDVSCLIHLMYTRYSFALINVTFQFNLVWNFLKFLNNFLKLYNSCTSIRGIIHLSKWFCSMLRHGVHVLLLFVSPFFALSFVPICMLFLVPVYDVVTSCVDVHCQVYINI